MGLEFGSGVTSQLPFVPDYVLNMVLIAFLTNQLNIEYFEIISFPALCQFQSLEAKDPDSYGFCSLPHHPLA